MLSATTDREGMSDIIESSCIYETKVASPEIIGRKHLHRISSISQPGLETDRCREYVEREHSHIEQDDVQFSLV